MAKSREQCLREFEERKRYVLAEDAETGTTRCFGVVAPEVTKLSRRKGDVYYYARTILPSHYKPLTASPFWLNPRLVARNDIPEGVTIP